MSAKLSASLCRIPPRKLHQSPRDPHLILRPPASVPEESSSSGVIGAGRQARLHHAFDSHSSPETTSSSYHRMASSAAPPFIAHRSSRFVQDPSSTCCESTVSPERRKLIRVSPPPNLRPPLQQRHRRPILRQRRSRREPRQPAAQRQSHPAPGFPAQRILCCRSAIAPPRAPAQRSSATATHCTRDRKYIAMHVHPPPLKQPAVDLHQHPQCRPAIRIDQRQQLPRRLVVLPSLNRQSRLDHRLLIRLDRPPLRSAPAHPHRSPSNSPQERPAADRSFPRSDILPSHRAEYSSVEMQSPVRSAYQLRSFGSLVPKDSYANQSHHGSHQVAGSDKDHQTSHTPQAPSPQRERFHRLRPAQAPRSILVPCTNSSSSASLNPRIRSCVSASARKTASESNSLSPRRLAAEASRHAAKPRPPSPHADCATGIVSSSAMSSARRMNAYTAHIASLLCRGSTRNA